MTCHARIHTIGDPECGCSSPPEQTRPCRECRYWTQHHDDDGPCTSGDCPVFGYAEAADVQPCFEAPDATP